MPVSRTFGSTTVIALADGAGPFFDARDAVFPGATAADWAEADRRDPTSVRDGRWWLRFRCFAIRLDNGRVILVDAGIGSATSPARTWAPVPGQLPAELAAAGVDRTDVDTVVLTHIHTDHIGWSIDDTGVAFFPRARYLLHQADVDALEARTPDIADWLLSPLREHGQLSTLTGRERLAEGLSVIPTPGHTPGHQSVLLDGTEQLLITGDLLVHMLQLIDPTRGYAHEDDPDTARASRTELLRTLAAGGPTVLATPHLGEPFVVLD